MRFRPTGFPLRFAGRFLLPLLFSLAIFPAIQTNMASAQAVTIGPTLDAVIGNRIQGYAGDGGPAASAELQFPSGMVFDPAGNLYFADYDNYVVRKVDTAGIITTVAGNGTLGYSGDGGPATSAGMDPIGVTLDNAGNLYILDYRNNRVRKVTAATGIITTVVGTGVRSFGGDGGPATQAEMNWPTGLALDNAGNLYIVDNSRIRKVSATTGIITTVAGNGTAGYGTAGYSGDGGPAVDAGIRPGGLIVDSAGDLYIANHAIPVAVDSNVTFGASVRKVTAATGIITTIAGTGVPGFSGDGGLATSAELNDPGAMAFDSVGNLYVADAGNNRVREVSATGIITTVVGNGPSYPTPCSFSDGTITGSDMCPWDLAFDGAGNLYIADASDGVIREMHPAPSPLIFPTTPLGDINPPTIIPLKINADGTSITSISVPVSQGGKQEYKVTDTGCALQTALSAGTVCDVSITFTAGYVGERPMPLQVNTSAGMFIFGMIGTGTGSEVALTPGTISTVAGNGTPGYSGNGGPAISAGMSPDGITFDSAGNLYLAGNNAIRKIAANTSVITTVAGNGTPGYTGDGGPATSAELQSNFITVDAAGNLYIGDTGNNAIRRVAANTGIITTVAGTGTQGFSGDGGPATSAELNLPGNIAFDNMGNLYFPDTANNRIRKVQATTGIIITVAGNGTQGYSGDNGPATSAELTAPVSIAIDSKNNLYISDTGNNVIRKVTVTGVITTVAGNGAPGYSGDGGPATSAKLHSPAALALDSANNLYISDENNNRIRAVTADTGIITTVAGNGTLGYSGDGGSATSAELDSPYGLVLDGTGNLYIADSGNNRIREVNVLESTLNYAITPLGATSADSPQTATMTNIGNDLLRLPGPILSLNPVISNDSFSLDQDSSCLQINPPPSTPDIATLGSGDSCTFLISFTPTKRGVNTGTATITDDALNTVSSTQIIHLNELGSSTGSLGDFTLSVTPSSQTVSAGSTATYTISITGTKGFTGPVSLTAMGFPPDATMTLNPTTVTISGTTRATATLTIATTTSDQQKTPSKGPLSGKSASFLFGALLLPLLGITRARKQLRSAHRVALLAIFGLLSLGVTCANLTGCANIGLQPDPQNYTITVQGTSGNLQHSTNVALAVDTYTTVKYK